MLVCSCYPTAVFVLQTITVFTFSVLTVYRYLWLLYVLYVTTIHDISLACVLFLYHVTDGGFPHKCSSLSVVLYTSFYCSGCFFYLNAYIHILVWSILFMIVIIHVLTILLLPIICIITFVLILVYLKFLLRKTFYVPLHRHVYLIPFWPKRPCFPKLPLFF